MKKVGDFVVYRKAVCKVIAIKEKQFRDLDYYVLAPIDDSSLKIDVPINNKQNYLRDLISKEEALNIIKKIPKVEIIQCDEKTIEPQYKLLLSNATHEDLIKIIKTTYLRNKERTDNKKKISDKDNHYFQLAEKYLYTEIGTVLGMNYEEAKKYIVEEVEKSSNKEKN